MSKNIYWTLLQHDDWNLHLAATDNGLCYVGSQGASFEELADWAEARLPGYELIRHDAEMERYTHEFTKYFQGSLDVFTLPLDLVGTAFQQKVWQAMNAVQYGSTVAYSDLAETIGRPQASRAVGAAVGANPLLIVLPCHRIVGKTGSMTGYRGGLPMKTALLELEQKRG
ncbi:methylated-DNA--[protein]-cysteine S-methyltransferase [Paenibacillus sp. MMO-58]|uniref:methylated-DNA--[protein]-cysteine S-methyltransferase n=1 Tax=Paenibacillus sp. MMO-58 TaxID=3081290 RepID=UPI003015E2D4